MIFFDKVKFFFFDIMDFLSHKVQLRSYIGLVYLFLLAFFFGSWLLFFLLFPLYFQIYCKRV